MRFLALVRWFVAIVLLVPASGWAQGTFSLDSVLITPPRVESEGLQPLADDLHGNLERMLSAEYLVVPFDDVPDYQDYSAGVYLASCPADQYMGCAWVMGSRSNAEWVVSTEMFDQPRGAAEALFTLIDVSESKPVISFSSKVEQDNHGPVAAGLSLVLDSVMRGDTGGDPDDVRGEVVDAREQWQRRREEAQAAAEELAFAEQGLEILVRPDVGGYDDPRLKVGDLEEWDARDDAAPWQQVGMSRGEYVRYKNSDTSLETWRDLQRGRLHQFVIALEGGAGAGSYTHAYDARWVLDDTTLDPVETDVHQQMQKGPSTGFALELLYGVHPWVEVGVGLASRSARFDWFYQREIEGEEIPQEIAKGQTFKYTPEYRVRGRFVPFPTLPVRPTGSLALAYWRGGSIDQVLQVDGPAEPFDPPWYGMVHLGPGIEVSPADPVVVYGRVDLQVQVVGSRVDSAHTGDEGLLQEPYAPPDLGMGGGWAVSFGVAARIGPFWGTK